MASVNDAMCLLDNYSSMQVSGVNAGSNYTSSEQFNLKLFEQWSELCTPEAQEKPPIRTIQHLSCTGGTLITKCLAAMPNVSLLSEVNPLSTMDDVHRSGFAPSDLIYLTKQNSFPLIEDLSKKIFRADIDVISEHARQLGRYLVLREHSHSSFHSKATPKSGSNIRSILGDDQKLLAILTVRHPLDSYLSLVNHGWIQFTPATIDEYCRRYLLFLKDNKKIPVFKYEMFVDNAPEQMKLMCEALALPFNEDFQDVFDLYSLSGDSGRRSDTISKRTRRECDEKLLEEVSESTKYLHLCGQLGYEA